MSFSFFNPTLGIYKTIKRGPLSITVHKGLENTAQITETAAGRGKGIVTFQKLGRDVIYIKNSPGAVMTKGSYLYKNNWFWFFQIIPWLLFILISVGYKRYLHLKGDRAYARNLKAPKVARQGLKEATAQLNNNHPREFYEVIFKTLQKYLGFKLRIAWVGITLDITDTLKEKGVREDIVEDVKHIFLECDRARYAPGEFSLAAMGKSMDKLREIMNYLGRNLR